MKKQDNIWHALAQNIAANRIWHQSASKLAVIMCSKLNVNCVIKLKLNVLEIGFNSVMNEKGYTSVMNVEG